MRGSVDGIARLVLNEDVGMWVLVDEWACVVVGFDV